MSWFIYNNKKQIGTLLVEIEVLRWRLSPDDFIYNDEVHYLYHQMEILIKEIQTGKLFLGKVDKSASPKLTRFWSVV